MSFVLDASTAIQRFLSDERTSASEEMLDLVRTEGAHVPTLFRWEIQNVLLDAERASRIDAEEVDDALELLRELPIQIEPPGSRVFAGNDVRLARFFDLTAYDAAYLSLAATLRIPLATDDSELAYAARDLGITVLP